VFHCHGGGNQLFTFVPATNDSVNQYYQIMNVNSHLCFEIASDNTTLEQAGCVGFDTEQWRLQDRPDLGPGAFILVNRQFSTMCATRITGNPAFPSVGTGSGWPPAPSRPSPGVWADRTVRSTRSPVPPGTGNGALG
jgi:ricin-type beta-trefoil lectin protein